MEKFFEVKGTTIEKFEKVIFKGGVIPVLVIVLPTTVLANGKAAGVGVALASIYLFVFYFITQMRK